jgi:hypothetical protein
MAGAFGCLPKRLQMRDCCRLYEQSGAMTRFGWEAAGLLSEPAAKSRTFAGVRAERIVLCPLLRERFQPRGVVPFQGDGAHIP